jgi:hypothetical protein
MRARVRRRVLAVLPLLYAACSGTAPEPEKVLPRLPGGSAGKVLARALDAAGGWERWAAARDVSFVGTLTLLDRDRNLSSESIGWYMAPLHSGMRARMESIGMSSAITFGVNGNDTWIFRDGARVEDPARLAVTRFDLVSSLFWFSLPFSLAEIPATITDLGSRSEGAAQWDRLKVEFEGAAASVPGQWFVLYIDHGTGLIDHVHAQLTAPFLRHDLWVGKWLEYHDQAGLKKERLREFYPADKDGAIVGPVVATQLVEHIRLNNGFQAELFDVPANGGGGVRARHSVPSVAAGLVPARRVQRGAASLATPGGDKGPGYTQIGSRFHSF